MASDNLDALFAAARQELFRLETLPAYLATGDAERSAQYAAGALFPEPRQPTAWTREIQRTVESGRKMPHVRLVTEPLSMYIRKSVDWFYPHHVDAGRDIYILTPGSELASEAAEVGDYWMFDSATVALMRYDDVGAYLGIDLVTEPGAVAGYAALRARLLAESQPFRLWLGGWRQRSR